MDNQNQSPEQSKWKIEVEGRGRNAVYNIVDEKGDYVFDTQCKPDAQRIVKAVKLLSIIEDEIFELGERDKTEVGKAILEELKRLLKQAEQK